MRAPNTANTVSQLADRMSCNASGADLNSFIFQIVKPRPDDVVLDIGCGLGKQLLAIEPRVASVTGIDVSSELLDTLRRQTKSKTTELVAADMDSVPGLLGARRFSLIYSAYAIYYSRDIAALVSGLAGLLTSDGRLFCVSPDAGNNSRWFSDLERFLEIPAAIRTSPHFSRDVILPAFLDTFDEVQAHKFNNPIAYRSVDEIMKYYDGCGSYCTAAARPAVESSFRKYLEQKREYIIDKRALGIMGTRRS